MPPGRSIQRRAQPGRAPLIHRYRCWRFSDYIRGIDLVNPVAAPIGNIQIAFGVYRQPGGLVYGLRVGWLAIRRHPDRSGADDERNLAVGIGLPGFAAVGIGRIRLPFGSIRTLSRNARKMALGRVGVVVGGSTPANVLIE